MSATTAMKARLFDLFAGTMELVRDGNRNGEEVAKVLQTIKDHANFATLLGFAAGILRTVATVSASATKSFCAKDYFVVVVKATENANVRIAWLGDNFRKHFLNKVEKHIDGAILAAHRLEPLRHALGIAMLAALADLRATRHRVPRHLGPFDVRFRRHGAGSGR